MQTSNAQTVDLVSDAPSSELSFGQAIGQILALAIPFAIGATAASVLNLGKVAMLSRAPDTGALHILSLMQPAFILVLALIEGLAITNQVFSAKSKRNWPKRGILKSTSRLSLIGLILLGSIAAISFGTSQVPAFNVPAIAATLEYLPAFVLSMALFLVFEIIHGALRGQGRTMQSLIPFIGLVVVDLLVTYILVTRYNFGFEAVLLGNLAGPLVMLPVAIVLLRVEAKDGAESPAEAFRLRLKQMTIGVGIPVFSSIVVGFVSAAVIFPILNNLGEDNASAFLVVLRFRIAFMIPAIAIGSAIAILVNQHDGDEGRRSHSRYLAIGIPVMLAAYGAAAASIPYWSYEALDLLMSRDATSLRRSTDLMMAFLTVTFFLVPASAMLQVILEQLGRGVHVLIITVITEVATCAGIVLAAQNGADLFLLTRVMVGCAVFSFVLFSAQLLILLSKRRSRNAI